MLQGPDHPASKDPPVADGDSQARPPASPAEDFGSINPLAFLLGTFAIILLTRLASYLTPYKLYFSFSSFFFDDARSEVSWEALGVKLATPCVVGFLLFLVPLRIYKYFGEAHVAGRRALRYLFEQAETTSRYAGFFAAFLMAWPYLVYWDVFARPDLYKYRLVFTFLYILYFMSYAYFAALGVSLAKLYLHTQIPSSEKHGLSANTAWVETIRTSVMGSATSGVAAFLAGRFAQGS